MIAHIRHAETPYDQLLMRGVERHEARTQVEGVVRAVLADWQQPDLP